MDAAGKHATGDNEGGQGKLSGSHVIGGKGGKPAASCNLLLYLSVL